MATARQLYALTHPADRTITAELLFRCARHLAAIAAALNERSDPDQRGAA